MRTLDPFELDYLLDFITPDGWIFHSSMGIDKFNDFTERTIGIRLMDLYPNEGLSKGKTLRRFVSEPGNEEKAYKLLSALIKYYEFKIRDTGTNEKRDETKFQKCREILQSYESVFNRTATNPNYDRIKEKFLSLYKDGAYWRQGDPAIGLSIALDPMTDLVRYCIASKTDGLFSNPLFIRTLVEIQRFGGEGTKPSESQQAEASWNTFISVLLPYINIFSKKKGTPLVKFKIFLDNHKRIYDNRGGFYRSLLTEPLIGLCEQCKNLAFAFHSADAELLETMYAGVFTNEWERFDFLSASDTPAPDQIEAEVQMNVSITRDIKYRGESKEKPKTIGEVTIEDFWSRFNKEKNKAKIGAPSADDHDANAYTQSQIANMFGLPCSEEIVANWESKARGSNRGSTPPSAMYKGRLESYRDELRKFPIGENVNILAAIIAQYKATDGVKATAAKPTLIHAKNEETLYRMKNHDGMVRTQNRADS